MGESITVTCVDRTVSLQTHGNILPSWFLLLKNSYLFWLWLRVILSQLLSLHFLWSNLPKSSLQVQVKETLTCSTSGNYEPDQGFACPVYSSAPSQTFSSCTIFIIVSLISQLIRMLSWERACVNFLWSHRVLVKQTVLYRVFNQKQRNENIVDPLTQQPSFVVEIWEFRVLLKNYTRWS